MGAGRGIVHRQAIEIGPRRRDLRHCLHHRQERIGQWRVSGQRQGAKGGAMIARIARDHLPARSLPDRDRILPRQLDGAFHRLGSAGDKEDFLHAFRRERCHPGGKLFACLGFEMQPVAEGGFLHLPTHGVQHPGIGMADIGHHGAGRAVEIAPAVNIPHVHAVGFGQNRAAGAGLVEQMALGFHEWLSTGSAAQSLARNCKATLAPVAKGWSSIMLMACI